MIDFKYHKKRSISAISASKAIRGLFFFFILGDKKRIKYFYYFVAKLEAFLII